MSHHHQDFITDEELQVLAQRSDDHLLMWQARQLTSVERDKAHLIWKNTMLAQRNDKLLAENSALQERCMQTQRSLDELKDKVQLKSQTLQEMLANFDETVADLQMTSRSH
jgi:hypothetical protein